jgi:protein ImuA
MSQGGGSERIGFLRAAIARIEAGGSIEKRPGLQGPGEAGAGAFGRVLAGGRGVFCEVAPAASHDRGAASGFALALAARCAREAGGPLLWVAEDFACVEWGVPYGPGLAAYGLAWRDLTLMRLPRRSDVWLAMEEAIRARVFAAIVAEPAGLEGAEAPKILRRLAMGARAAGARMILLRPPAGERLPFLAPTPLRFEVAARPAPRPAAGRRPLPGQGAWRVRYAGPGGRLPQFGSDAFHEVDLSPVDLSPADFALRLAPAPTAAPTEDFIGAALSLRPLVGLSGRAA